MDYQEFIQQKGIITIPTGIENADDLEINPMLFDFQKAIVKWALRRGRAAIFADCGLGKTPMQLEWARHVCNHTGGRVLIVAPLAVSLQTKHEGVKFGIHVNVCRSQADTIHGINITNYEMIHKFDPGAFAGIVLDESSILKSFTGKYRTQLIEMFGETKFKLCCTATPAPNDFVELGNHSEFLNIMKREEMLSMFFYNDGSESSKWVLKGHAQSEFWKWVASWSVYIRKPSDIGFDDSDFILPEIRLHEIIVETNQIQDGALFVMPAITMQERIGARRASIPERSISAARIANGTTEPVIVWCNLNNEAQESHKAIPGSVEISGSDNTEVKEKAMIGFQAGDFRTLVTKPKIAGFGMNWQHCHTVIFNGLSDSWEAYYQAVRRCWRFGQKHPVDVYIIVSDTEGMVLENIKRKERDAMNMAQGIIDNMNVFQTENIKGAARDETQYKERIENGESWRLYLGDCVEVTRNNIESESIDFSVFSPPFASLYTYSDMARDMGNNKSDDEFFDHFKYLIAELFRITKPGRNCAVHCMNLPSTKQRDGYIGIRDFRGEIIRYFVAAGWIYHSEVCIWKDPVTAMQRTKALGLLYKQIKKDSTRCRMGIPDYLVTFRKPGDNAVPVEQCPHDFPVSKWQQWASPIWMDIKQGNTLQKEREEKDEKHICPLQLDVIERAVTLWSNKHETVFSPFAGIGSEGYQSILLNRKFIGIELKESYYEQAIRNLRSAETLKSRELGELEFNEAVAE